MKGKAFNGNDSILVIGILTEYKRDRNSSRIHEGTAVGLDREFINSPVLATNKARLILLSNNANSSEGTIKVCAQVVNQILRRYVTYAVIAKADEEIRNFEHVPLTSCDFFQKSFDVMLQCSGVYNRQTLQRFFAESKYLITRITMRSW